MYTYIYIYTHFFIDFVFPKVSTLELGNKTNGPRILILHEISSLEPAPKVQKPKSKSKTVDFVCLFEQI